MPRMIVSLIRVRRLTSVTLRPARQRACARSSPMLTARLHCRTAPRAAPARVRVTLTPSSPRSAPSGTGAQPAYRPGQAWAPPSPAAGGHTKGAKHPWLVPLKRAPTAGPTAPEVHAALIVSGDQSPMEVISARSVPTPLPVWPRSVVRPRVPGVAVAGHDWNPSRRLGWFCDRMVLGRRGCLTTRGGSGFGRAVGQDWQDSPGTGSVAQ